MTFSQRLLEEGKGRLLPKEQQSPLPWGGLPDSVVTGFAFKQRQGIRRGTWATRYITLEGTKFSWARSENQAPRGVVRVDETHCQILSVPLGVEGTKVGRYGWQIVDAVQIVGSDGDVLDTTRTILFSSEDEKERSVWLNRLRGARWKGLRAKEDEIVTCSGWLGTSIEAAITGSLSLLQSNALLEGYGLNQEWVSIRIPFTELSDVTVEIVMDETTPIEARLIVWRRGQPPLRLAHLSEPLKALDQIRSRLMTVADPASPQLKPRRDGHAGRYLLTKNLSIAAPDSAVLVDGHLSWHATLVNERVLVDVHAVEDGCIASLASTRLHQTYLARRCAEQVDGSALIRSNPIELPSPAGSHGWHAWQSVSASDKLSLVLVLWGDHLPPRFEVKGDLIIRVTSSPNTLTQRIRWIESATSMSVKIGKTVGVGITGDDYDIAFIKRSLECGDAGFVQSPGALEMCDQLEEIGSMYSSTIQATVKAIATLCSGASSTHTRGWADPMDAIVAEFEECVAAMMDARSPPESSESEGDEPIGKTPLAITNMRSDCAISLAAMCAHGQKNLGRLARLVSRESCPSVVKHSSYRLIDLLLSAHSPGEAWLWKHKSSKQHALSQPGCVFNASVMLTLLHSSPFLEQRLGNADYGNLLTTLLSSFTLDIRLAALDALALSASNSSLRSSLTDAATTAAALYSSSWPLVDGEPTCTHVASSEALIASAGPSLVNLLAGSPSFKASLMTAESSPVESSQWNGWQQLASAPPVPRRAMSILRHRHDLMIRNTHIRTSASILQALCSTPGGREKLIEWGAILLALEMVDESGRAQSDTNEKDVMWALGEDDSAVPSVLSFVWALCASTTARQAFVTSGMGESIVPLLSGVKPLVSEKAAGLVMVLASDGSSAASALHGSGITPALIHLFGYPSTRMLKTVCGAFMTMSSSSEAAESMCAAGMAQRAKRALHSGRLPPTEHRARACLDVMLDHLQPWIEQMEQSAIEASMATAEEDRRATVAALTGNDGLDEIVKREKGPALVPIALTETSLMIRAPRGAIIGDSEVSEIGWPPLFKAFVVAPIPPAPMDRMTVGATAVSILVLSSASADLSHNKSIVQFMLRRRAEALVRKEGGVDSEIVFSGPWNRPVNSVEYEDRWWLHSVETLDSGWNVWRVAAINKETGWAGSVVILGGAGFPSNITVSVDVAMMVTRSESGEESTTAEQWAVAALRQVETVAITLAIRDESEPPNEADVDIVDLQYRFDGARLSDLNALETVHSLGLTTQGPVSNAVSTIVDCVRNVVAKVDDEEAVKSIVATLGSACTSVRGWDASDGVLKNDAMCRVITLCANAVDREFATKAEGGLVVLSRIASTCGPTGLAWRLMDLLLCYHHSDTDFDLDEWVGAVVPKLNEGLFDWAVLCAGMSSGWIGKRLVLGAKEGEEFELARLLTTMLSLVEENVPLDARLCALEMMAKVASTPVGRSALLKEGTTAAAGHLFVSPLASDYFDHGVAEILCIGALPALVNSCAESKEAKALLMENQTSGLSPVASRALFLLKKRMAVGGRKASVSVRLSAALLRALWGAPGAALEIVKAETHHVARQALIEAASEYQPDQSEKRVGWASGGGEADDAVAAVASLLWAMCAHEATRAELATDPMVSRALVAVLKGGGQCAEKSAGALLALASDDPVVVHNAGASVALVRLLGAGCRGTTLRSVVGALAALAASPEAVKEMIGCGLIRLVEDRRRPGAGAPDARTRGALDVLAVRLEMEK